MHKFAQLTPSGEIEIDFFPYFVALPFLWPLATFWNRIDSITADTWKVVDVDFSLLLIPHFPIGGVPGPGQVKNLLKIIGTSGSEASLGIGSVVGGGDPLAACFVGPVAVNFNCWEYGDQATGAVVCVCSVQTTPTLLDYLLFGLKWISVAILGEYVGKFMGKLLKKHIARIPEDVWEVIFKQIVVNVIEQIAVLIRVIVRRLSIEWNLSWLA